jgi:hypothetical protein
VEETLKGTPPARLRVAQLGGRVDNRAMPIEGAASFKPDEEVILFLIRNPDVVGEFYLAGMSQGKLAATGQGDWAWAPTAPLWEAGQIFEPRSRRIDANAMRRLLRGAP